jgi:hypothetical protein
MAGFIEKELIDSVGIEIEFSKINRNSKKLKNDFNINNLDDYRLVHDASCETPAKFFADTDFPIKFSEVDDLLTLAPIVKKTVIGGEIVSPIRNSGSEKWIHEIHKLVTILDEFGEDESSERDSFHVHVNVSQSIPLHALKNLLKITLSLEAILYRLGGMGRLNRGQQNQYTFCRPFLGNGPPVVVYNMSNGITENIPCLDTQSLLNVQTKTDFFKSYGDSVFYAERNTRYVTQRYMCVNFYPILTQGSFEFRTANKTLNPEYIIAWTNLCKSLVRKAFFTLDPESLDKTTRPLYENRIISDEEFIDSLKYYDDLDEDTVDVLHDIWINSPTPMFDNIWRYSHLREPTRFHNKSCMPDKLDKDIEVLSAEFVDIHQLENQENNIRFGHGVERRFNPDLMDRFHEANFPIIEIDHGETWRLHEPISVLAMGMDFAIEFNYNGIQMRFEKVEEEVVYCYIWYPDNEYEAETHFHCREFDPIYITEQILDECTLEDCTPA